MIWKYKTSLKNNSKDCKLGNILKLIYKNEDNLLQGVTEKQMESFEKLKDCQS